ncbi:MAG: hypothetical protein Q4E73_06850 [Lachnospiraceae bacterium]|nr:hypothetical protein [Lachnospiraceae bacterium]
MPRKGKRTRNETLQKQALREFTTSYLKENDMTVQDGNDVNFIKTLHTSYGDMQIDISRDRQGDFEPFIHLCDSLLHIYFQYMVELAIIPITTM